MNLKNIANKIGLTKTEFNVLFVLILVFILGLSIKLFQFYYGSQKAPIFNYSKSDSLFYSSSEQIDSTEEISSVKNNSVEKTKVLELYKRESFKKTEKLTANERIKINSAGINELVKLPGIGEKTAVKILELRKQRGKITRLEELKDVQGIGNSKFENIKNYIIID